MAQQHRFAASVSGEARPPGHRPSLRRESLLLFLAILWPLHHLLLVAATTSEDTSYYYVGCYTARVDLTMEQLYSKVPQVCVEICESKEYSYSVVSDEKCYCTNEIIPEDRQDDLLCSTRCLSSKSEYCGGVGVHSYYSTEVAKSAAAKDLKIANVTENSLTVAWLAYVPMKQFIAGVETIPLTRISNYMIRTERLHTFSSQPFYQQPEFIVQGSENRFEITDLHPATEYNITVESLCESSTQGASKCGTSWIVGSTAIGIPSPPPPAPKVLSSTDKTITVQIKPVRNNNGPVTKVLVIVERVDDSITQPFDEELLGSWKHAEEAGLPYYIAAELDYDRPGDNKTRKFIVGDGKRYGRYINVPLNNNTSSDWHVSLGVISTLNNVTKHLYTRSTHEQHISSMDNFSYSTFDAGTNSVVALIVTCTIFAICFIISVITYFYLRYKTCQMRSGRHGNSHEMTMQQPIIERENNGYVVGDDLPPSVENFKEQLNGLVDRLETSKRIPRNNVRLNVNDIIASGNYGDVITGKLMQNSLPESTADCQLHVLSLDELTSFDQAKLLQEFRNLIKLQPHPNILDFYGVSASTDWFYFVFEHQPVSLKRRLIESRRAPSGAVQRITSLSEQLVLQWIYEVASAMEYLSKSKVVHKHLTSHCIYVTPDMKLKVSVFGPCPYVQNQKKVDLTRWLAPEALRYQHYSTKSDVWSFAVVAWECCSLGATPYPHVTSPNKVLDALKSGSRPAQPSFVYQDLYQMLLNCWTLEPSERINFEDIALSVRQMMTSPRHALCYDVQPSKDNSGSAAVVDALPFYMPMLEMEN